MNIDDDIRDMLEPRESEVDVESRNGGEATPIDAVDVNTLRDVYWNFRQETIAHAPRPMIENLVLEIMNRNSRFSDRLITFSIDGKDIENFFFTTSEGINDTTDLGDIKTACIKMMFTCEQIMSRYSEQGVCTKTDNGEECDVVGCTHRGPKSREDLFDVMCTLRTILTDMKNILKARLCALKRKNESESQTNMSEDTYASKMKKLQSDFFFDNHIDFSSKFITTQQKIILSTLKSLHEGNYRRYKGMAYQEIVMYVVEDEDRHTHAVDKDEYLKEKDLYSDYTIKKRINTHSWKFSKNINYGINKSI
jgi:hypothetical protein